MPYCMCWHTERSISTEGSAQTLEGQHTAELQAGVVVQVALHDLSLGIPAGERCVIQAPLAALAALSTPLVLVSPACHRLTH